VNKAFIIDHKTKPEIVLNFLAVVAVETKVELGYSGGHFVGNFGRKF